MSDRSVTTPEQRGGSPSSREMDDERREGRRQHAQSDSEAAPSDDEDQMGRGGRIRDAAAGEVNDDGELRCSRDPPDPHSPPATQWQRSTVDTAPPAQVRSVVTRPVQLRLTGGRGRATARHPATASSDCADWAARQTIPQLAIGYQILSAILKKPEKGHSRVATSKRNRN